MPIRTMIFQGTGRGIFDIPPRACATINNKMEATAIRTRAKIIGGTVFTESFVIANELPQMIITAISSKIDDA